MMVIVLGESNWVGGRNPHNIEISAEILEKVQAVSSAVSAELLEVLKRGCKVQGL